MKILLFILTALFFTASSQSGWIKKSELACNEPCFLTDHMGQIYIISDKTITKYSAEAKKLSEYSNNRLGSISFADVSDPLRIMLFYHDFNQIVFLNKELSELSEPVVLDDLGAGQAETGCASSLGGFWIYASTTQQLIYYNKNLEPVHQSENITGITNSDSLPVFITEKNGFVYMNIPGSGILVFDQFGKYYKTIQLHRFTSFQVFDDQLVYFVDNKLMAYNTKLLEFSEVSQLTHGADFACIQNNRVFVLKDNIISLFEKHH